MFRKRNTITHLLFVLIGVIIGGLIIYSYFSLQISENFFIKLSDIAAARSYLKFRKIKNSFIPKGIPSIYGSELGISFDQVQNAIDKVALFDPTYGKENIKLTGLDLKRYIKIGLKTSCEYCCGAKTLVFRNGEAACGCAHSQMMRGLLAYLIKNHSDLSDEQMLEELNKWKRTYFPKQTLSVKLQELKNKGDRDVQKLLEEFPEFLPQMVGGC